MKFQALTTKTSQLLYMLSDTIKYIKNQSLYI